MPLSIEEQKRRLEVARTALNMPEADYRKRLAAIEGQRAPIPGPKPRLPAARGDDIRESECTSPYRFVDINTEVVGSPVAAPSHAAPLVGGYCAEINVTFEAETPLLIGAEHEEGGRPVALPLSSADPMRGPWWIPGASLRGMIRAAAEIVGYGRLEQVNRDYVFALRDFEHPDYNDTEGLWGGRALGRIGDVKAAWLRREGGVLVMREAKLYFLLISHILSLPKLPSSNLDTWNQQSLTTKYSQLGMIGDNRPNFDKDKTLKFNAELPGKAGQPLVIPDKSGKIEGVIVVSNKSPKQPAGREKFSKKHEYVFTPFDSQAQAHKLLADSYKRFEQVHSKPGRGEDREAEGSWIELKKVLDRGEPVPVFYVGDLATQNENFAFGLTRLFKIPHRNRVGDLVDRIEKHRMPAPYAPDMVTQLFGYVIENSDDEALKGRVAFSGAKIADDAARCVGAPDDRPMQTVMGSPKASFAPYYLQGDVRDWSDDPVFYDGGDTRIAGRKRYLPRQTPGDGAMAAALKAARSRFQQQVAVLSTDAQRSERTKSQMRFLVGAGDKPFRFESRILLHNVAAAEIGLALFALTFGGGEAQRRCRHMLGRAKPFGMGQLRVVDAKLTAEPNDEGEVVVDHSAFLTVFYEHMKSTGVAGYPDTPIIREFLGAADPANGAALPGSNSGEPIYLLLKDHRKLRQQAGALHKDPAKINRRGPKRLLAAPRWEGELG